MMNIRDLHYLVTLSKVKHVARSAELCHVSQPTLSMQIKKLEQTLNVPLTEKQGKKIHLTVAGIALAKKAELILKEVEDLKNLAKNLSDPFSGSLRLGIIPSISPYYLPKWIPIIKKNFPKIELYITEEKTEVLLNKIYSRELDAIILADHVQGDSLSSHILFSEEFLLAVHPSHPYAKKKGLNSSELNFENLLLLEEGHCFRDQALAYCEKYPFNEKPFGATSFETLQCMVASGEGITFIPECAVKKNKDIAYLHIKNHPPKRKVFLIWNKSGYREKLLEMLLKKLANS